MSDVDSEVCEAVVVDKVLAKKTTHEALLESARDKMARFAPRAIEIITELAETSENDRVRLAAAESLADRAGLGKSSTTHIQVNTAEHEAARLEAEELVARMNDQRAVQAPVVEPSLESLIVHEGEIA